VWGLFLGLTVSGGVITARWASAPC